MRKLCLTYIILTVVILAFGVVTLYAKPRPAKAITPGTKGTVLLFVASLCPCTDAHRVMVENLLEQNRSKGINFYGVFSNIGESQELVEYFFRSIGWQMPYLLDSSGVIAKKYKATHTPQAVVLSQSKKVLYRGPIDDSNLNQGRVTKAYLKNALDDILVGRTIKTPEVTATGCWIVRDTTSIACRPGQ